MVISAQCWAYSRGCRWWVQSALLVCSSPWPELLALLKLSWGAASGHHRGMGTPFFLAVSMRQTSTRIWPLCQHCRTQCEGGNNLCKAGDSGADSLQPAESLACVLCSAAEVNVVKSYEQMLELVFHQGQKPNLLSKHQPFLMSSYARKWALIYFPDLNVQHFGLHRCFQSCTRALLCSLLFSVFLLVVWRRAWIYSMPLPYISHCPVPWKVEMPWKSRNALEE